MRCPDCNKFVSLEFEDPEVENLQVEHIPPETTDQGVPHMFLITGSVRLVRNCGECGQELKEATLEIEQEVELGEDVPARDWAEFAKTHDLDDAYVDESPAVDQIEEGGGRYAKSYFGASIHFEVFMHEKTVGKGSDPILIAAVEWSDKIAASHMDELV
jgi:hypothetical protein